MALRPLRLAPPLLAAAAAAVVLAPSGSAAPDAVVGPTHVRDLAASGTTQRPCARTLLDGARGTRRSTFTAPADGWVTAKLAGTAAAGDWDLGVFDASGRRIAGSGAFGAAEVVQTTVVKGARTIVQACRRPGAARSVPLRVTYFAINDELRAKASKQAAEKLSYVRIKVPNRQAIQTLIGLGIDLGEDGNRDGITAVLHGAKDADILRKAGFPFRVLRADLMAYDRQERAQERAYARKVGRFGSPLPSGRTDYRTLEDIQADLKKLVADRPDIARAQQLKLKSFQGRELSVIEIGRDVQKPNDGKPYFIINGMHHAREWPAAESPVEFAIDLVKNDGKDPRITKIIDNARILIMPVTNADGYVHSRGSAIEEGLFVGQYRRKNCGFPFPAGAVPCEAQTGVDPNRNYGYEWGGPGASSLPISDTYRGPAPWSEPEPRAVQELVSKFPATSFLTIHNVAALVLRPPGLELNGFAPDEPRLKVLGDKMAKATGYTSQYGWQLYDTTGTTDDWSYPTTGGFGYTIEMGPPGGDFHADYNTSMITQYDGSGKFKGQGLREAYLLAAENAFVEQDTARIAGRAPGGRTLRITKDFKTHTYPVCTVVIDLLVAGPNGDCPHQGPVLELDEHLEHSIVVPASGRFKWWVNPSTRPFELKAGKTELYKLACEDGGKVIETHEVLVKRGETLKLDLPCGGVLVDDTPPVLLSVAIGDLSLSARRVNKRRGLSVNVSLSGGTLAEVTVELRKGSKVYAATALPSLSTSGKVKLKLAGGKRVKKGNFTIVLRGKQASGAAFEVVKAVKVRR